MELYIILLWTSVGLWLLWRWKKTSVWKNLGIPGPPPNLIFGNILELYIKGPMKCHEEWVKKYGRVLGYFYGMTPVILVADPYILKNIFIKDFHKFPNRELFNPLKRYTVNDKSLQSVFNVPGQEWKYARSILTPTFTSSKMKLMVGTFRSSIETMLEILQKNAQKGITFDIFNVYQRLSLDILLKTAFGIQTDVQQNTKSRLLRVASIIISTPYKDAITFLGVTFPILRRFCLHLQIIVDAIKNKGRSPMAALLKGLKCLIEMRRNDPEIKKIDLIQLMLNSSASAPEDYLKQEAGFEDEKNEETSYKKTRKLKDHEILQTSKSLLIAGYETTSASLGFLTYLLGKHQDVQRKVNQEINELFEKGHELEYSTINQLLYLDKVICESLRMYPPATLFTNRYAAENVHYGNVYIPKGTLIQASACLMHYDREFWSSPEVFCPERFNNKPNTEGITYMPFGAGPRICLGMRFALLQIKLVIALVVYNFNIYLDEKQKDNLNVLIRLRTLSLTNLGVKLEPRRKDG